VQPKGRSAIQIGGSVRAIWPTYHVVSFPAIMGVHGTIATMPWIFMQAIISRERAHMPPSGFGADVLCGGNAGGFDLARDRLEA
jgi:hypothetical protein